MIVSFESNIVELIRQFLDVAEDVVINDSCNDWDLPDTPENRVFVQAAQKWDGYENSEELDIRNGRIQTTNLLLIQYLSYLCKKAIVPGE